MAARNNYYVDPQSGNDTTGDGTIGTPWKTVQKALNTITRDATDGDQINVKAGTADTISSALSYATYGTPTAAAPLVIRGYTSTAEDGGHGAITLSGNIQLTSAAWTYTSLVNMDITGGGSYTNWLLNWGSYCYLRGCVFAANGVSNGPLLTIGGAIVGCRFTGFATYACRTTACLVYGNYVDTCAVGISCVGASSAIGNIVLMNGNGIAIDVGNQIAQAVGNIVYNRAAGTGIGIRLSGESLQLGLAVNNIVCGYSGVGGVGIGSSALNAQATGYNAFWNNTANESYAHQLVDDLGGDVTLAADPFTDAANGDFSLTAAGKTALRGVGWPAAYLGAHANTDGHITIGPIQYGEAEAGGGGGPVIGSRIIRGLGAV